MELPNLSDVVPTPRRFTDMVEEETKRLQAMTPEERAAAHLVWRASIALAVPFTTGPPTPSVPLRFEHRRFKHYKPTTKSQGLALQLAQDFVHRAAQGKGPMVALVGPTGVGKSHLLYAAVWELFEKHKTGAKVVQWYTFADELRYGRVVAGQPDVSPQGVRSELYAAKIVLVDEIRYTSGTPFDSTELIKFSCHASDNGVAVFLTSNANPLNLVMGPESEDRFEVLVVDGKSHR